MFRFYYFIIYVHRLINIRIKLFITHVKKYYQSEDFYKPGLILALIIILLLLDFYYH